MKDENGILMVMVLLVFVMVGTSSAVTVTLGADADATVSGYPTVVGNNYGSLPSLKPLYWTSHSFSELVYIRFVLPTDIDTVNSVTLRLDTDVVIASNKSMGLWGLDDGASGQDWGETAITYSNAPATYSHATHAFTANGTELASFATTGSNNGGAVGDDYDISSAGLLSFLNADTDNTITLMLDTDTSTSAAHGFASTENGSYNAPQLILDYTAVPEPATMALLGLGSLLCVRRRR